MIPPPLSGCCLQQRTSTWRFVLSRRCDRTAGAVGVDGAVAGSRQWLWAASPSLRAGDRRDLFRGVMLTALQRAWGNDLRATVVSLIFVALHAGERRGIRRRWWRSARWDSDAGAAASHGQDRAGNRRARRLQPRHRRERARSHLTSSPRIFASTARAARRWWRRFTVMDRGNSRPSVSVPPASSRITCIAPRPKLHHRIDHDLGSAGGDQGVAVRVAPRPLDVGR